MNLDFLSGIGDAIAAILREPARPGGPPGDRRLHRDHLARVGLLGVPRHAGADLEPGPPIPCRGAHRRVHARLLHLRHHRLPDHPAAGATGRGLRARARGRGPDRRDRADRALRHLWSQGARGLDHLPDLPNAPQARLPALLEARRPRMVAVRLVRPRLRAARGPGRRSARFRFARPASGPRLPRPPRRPCRRAWPCRPLRCRRRPRRRRRSPGSRRCRADGAHDAHDPILRRRAATDPTPRG